jgi:hypothetical protein
MLSNEYCSGSIRSIRPDEKIDDKKCQMEINPRSNCQRGHDNSKLKSSTNKKEKDH